MPSYYKTTFCISRELRLAGISGVFPATYAGSWTTIFEPVLAPLAMLVDRHWKAGWRPLVTASDHPLANPWKRSFQAAGDRLGDLIGNDMGDHWKRHWRRRLDRHWRPCGNALGGARGRRLGMPWRILGNVVGEPSDVPLAMSLETRLGSVGNALGDLLGNGIGDRRAVRTRVRGGAETGISTAGFGPSAEISADECSHLSGVPWAGLGEAGYTKVAAASVDARVLAVSYDSRD